MLINNVNRTRKEKIVSESINLGQINKSTDNVRIGKAKDIAISLTFNSKRIFENKIKENKTKLRLRIIKAYCQPDSKSNFSNAIITTGVVYI